MAVSVLIPAAAAGLLMYAASLAIYRLYFHPLAKFPGPKLAAITEYWELYQDFIRNEGGYLFFELDKLHEKYGPIVRIRTNELHVKDSTWMSVLYTGPTDPRDRDPFTASAIGVPDATIATGPYELHRIRRGAIAPMFSPTAMNKIEASVVSDAQKVVTDMETRKGETLDLRVYYLAWTTDFISDFIFRKSTELFWKPERARAWFSILWEFSRMTPLVKHAPWMISSALELPLLTWKVFMPRIVPYISLYQDLLTQGTDAYGDYVSKGRKLSEKQDTEPEGVFEQILASKLPEEQKMPKRMANEAYNLLVAGGLSTAKTAAIGTFHVLANPEIERKLRAEVKEAIPERNTLPDTAVVREMLRIGSPVTMRVPMIAKHKELKYGNLVIPAGTSVSMTYCKAGLDPEIFPEPYKFNPDRWLNGMQKPSDYDNYVLPFGKGGTVCLGKQLAYAQLYTVFAAIFRRVKLELYETTRDKDIDFRGGGPLGEPYRASKGTRVKITGTVD